MKFGAVLPTCELGDDPIAIRDWAQAAESLGYSHIVAYDHVLGAVHEGRDPKLWGPYTENDPFHEPFVVFGFLAGVTTTIEFETAVIILPQRQTALVAKQAAEVDVLSGGRLRLGVGTGWNHVEYEALGVKWADRGKIFDDQIELLRKLWTGDVVDHSSSFHRVDRAGILPRPVRSIPIWFGGFSNIAMRRAARVGDGFTFASAGTKTIDNANKLRQAVSDAGRDPATFPIELTVPYGLSQDKWETLVTEAREANISHLCVNTMSTTSEWAGTPAPNLTTTAQHIEALETFKTRVG
ncbi:MAG: putative F420-dependent oxidoreductase [Acidimicrobiales bacterium]|jgi:probable F420-dependent oxidoreductase